MSLSRVFGTFPVAREELAGNAVVISGCDSGFGQMVTLELLSLGMDVFAGCLTPQGDLIVPAVAVLLSIQTLQELAAARKSATSGALTAALLDVTSDNSVEQFAATVTLARPSVFCLVNNAGIAFPGLVEIFPMHMHRNTFEVNYFGVLRMTRAFAPLLRAHAAAKPAVQPRVVTIGSVAGEYAAPTLSAYSASKHAVRALMDSLRVEFKQFGIQVCIVEPFFARTPMVTSNRVPREVEYFNAANDEVKAAYGEYSEQYTNAQANIMSKNFFVMEPEHVVRQKKVFRMKNV
ncbi:Retinol dehydrogenase 5 [Entophlyctis luteolus]|nr:Retinol dehydrogenase 5 [Entophlyctis luteolus]